MAYEPRGDRGDRGDRGNYGDRGDRGDDGGQMKVRGRSKFRLLLELP